MNDARIRFITVLGAVMVLLFVLDLVRRRRLKEEYSVLWVATAVVLLVLSVWYGALNAITRLIGGSLPSSTLFFFGLLFVVVMLLHFSVRVSVLERRLTALVQEIGLMRLEQPPPAQRPRVEEGPDAEEPARAAREAVAPGPG